MLRDEASGRIAAAAEEEWGAVVLLGYGDVWSRGWEEKQQPMIATQCLYRQQNMEQIASMERTAGPFRLRYAH
jgi:hypothetical protein